MNKVLWFLLGFLVVGYGISALAYDVPQDAVIKVFDKSGKEIGSMSRKQYKVVKIEDHPQVTIPGATAVLNQKQEPTEERAKKVIFSAIILGGSGYDGVEQTYSNGVYTVYEKREAVGQLNLCASKGRFGLCGAAGTNKFYGGGLKVDLN